MTVSERAFYRKGVGPPFSGVRVEAVGKSGSICDNGLSRLWTNSGRKAMRVLIALVAVVVVGCGGAAPSASLNATAASSPAAASPTASPTEAAEATQSADDAAISSLIKDTTAEVLDLVDADFDNMTDPEIGQLFERIKDRTSTAQTKLGIYTPSNCTAEAHSTALSGLAQLEEGAQAFLNWMATGADGDAPSSGFADGARELGEAVRAIGCE